MKKIILTILLSISTVFAISIPEMDDAPYDDIKIISEHTLNNLLIVYTCEYGNTWKYTYHGVNYTSEQVMEQFESKMLPSECE